NRDFRVADRARTTHYRGRQDSALALYYLWRTGEVMTPPREERERVDALPDRVAPSRLILEENEAEADRGLVKEPLAFHGLARLQRTSDAFLRGVPFSKVQGILDELLSDGEIIEVRIEGWKPIHYGLASDTTLLNDLVAGRTPQA